MRRYDVRDITEHQFRVLRHLLSLKLAEAHIVVRSERTWPPPISFSPRQPETHVQGDAIN